jgi:O-succinylbenzoate synthase
LIDFLLFLRLRTDCNADNTTLLLKKWTGQVEKKYAKVDFLEKECGRPEEKHPFQKDDERRRHVESLRDDALNFARSTGLDYVLVW